MQRTERVKTVIGVERLCNKHRSGTFSRKRVDPAIVTGQLIPGISSGYRPDFRSERHRLIVEFDGPEHYRSAKKILGDVERDRALTCVGYRIVRIPYFVQLTHVVIATLFGEIAIHHGDFLNFPHGFIAKTVVMPADFCELGLLGLRQTLSVSATSGRKSLRVSAALSHLVVIGAWFAHHPDAMFAASPRDAERYRQGDAHYCLSIKIDVWHAEIGS